jgi:hypothetical protein
VYYGQEAVAHEWLETLVGWDKLAPLFDEFARHVQGRDCQPRTQKLFIGGLFGINAVAFILFGLILGWI